jgi:glycosyltransferase involved in cell wall biosynthesis
MHMNSVCIISPNILPLLLPESSIPVVGGIEVQENIVAQLIMKKNRVTFVSFDFGISRSKLPKTPFSLLTFPSTKSGDGRIRRFLNVLLFAKAMDDARADVYFMMGSSHLTGLAAIYCIFRQRRFVFQVASQNDLDPHAIRGLCTHLSRRVGTIFAHSVLVQTDDQRRHLASERGRASDIVPNPVDLPQPYSKEDETDGSIVWVGTIRRLKRPDLFVEIAKQIPDGKFVLFGPQLQEEEDYLKNIQSAALNIPNLQLRGFLPHAEMLSEFRRAGILVNTSEFEGFPNTFLEAWSNYVPVISLNWDPDDVICRHRLGFHSGDIGQMKLDITRLMRDSRLTRELGSNGRRYVETHHSMEVISDLYERQFTRSPNKRSKPEKAK